MKRTIILQLLMLLMSLNAAAQQITLSGRVTDGATGEPVAFATILLKESGQWAVTNDAGAFSVREVARGRVTLLVQCLGYEKRSWAMTVNRSIDNLRLKLHQQNLKLDGVTVTARRKHDEGTTSYTIDRTALDNQQILNIGDIATLLPGGKTVNPTLMNDNRLALRSGSSEKGNAAFGTAIEIDGARLDNNAMGSETTGASTRTVSASNIESVEIVTGIPSVEYGDLSNGIVKVNTRKGKSPFIVEGSLTQHTRQIALNKGFDLGQHRGVLNASLEHARSFQNAASPYTAYQRNILSMNYMNVLMAETAPLTLNIGVTGNIGGYNSEADPDETNNEYRKARDNQLRMNARLEWLLNKPWITNLQMSASLSLSDRKSETCTYNSSAATLPYLHATETGYYMAGESEALTLSPTGYWYTTAYNDQKPMNWAAKLKGEWHKRTGGIASHLMAGADYTGSRNQGRGLYYADAATTPTWREYRYDALPTMHNLALYAEAKVMIPTTRRATLELTAGLRHDLTMINGSDYGNVGSLSPRFNGRYIFWRNQRQLLIRQLEMHAGWGKSVKLPSFQVLYPAPSYTDREVFAATSDARNRSFRAYHTTVQQALYNSALRWQYTNQTDIGLEMDIRGTRVAVSGFCHSTNRAYMAAGAYGAFSYRYTAAANSGDALQQQYSIDRQTGVVTMTNSAGTTTLEGTMRKTFTQSTTYMNSETPIRRYGLEWTIDFAQIRPLRTSIRLDGNYYYYKGTDEMLFADVPLGVNSYQSDGQLYQYVGYYRGSNATGTGYTASASVANGALQKQLNQNITVTTHIPRIRLIVALRVESQLYNYRRSLSELSDGTRGYVLTDADGYTGEPYDGETTDRMIVVYPEYYTTWDNPQQMVPFAGKFLWARDNDPQLFSDLSKLVVRSNYAYTMNPNRLSAYYSANLSVTKEIGDHVSLSFYANNFFNTMRRVTASQTSLETSLFGSGYVPGFYYGLSLKLKL